MLGIKLQLKLKGRPSGKELIHSLTDDEKDLAHVHVLINYAEVKPYLE